MSTTRDDEPTKSAWRGFPGGAARLPRISRPDDGSTAPPVVYVESAFLNRARTEVDELASDSGFGRYFTSESLFDAGEDHAVTTDEQLTASDAAPYRMLGIDRWASWEEVARAHRALVSQLHPDRYVGAEDDIRAAAERRVRDVNEAYAEIRRLRAPGGR